MNLYIHVPFCARRCSYCDFAIAVRRDVPSERFVDLILQEWSSRQSEPGWDAAPAVDTIYLGGGTPSLLAPPQLRRLLEGLRAVRGTAAAAEVTLEANPDDVSRERAGAWLEAGVTRVSLGVQSFEQPVLEWMHRTHDAAAATAAVKALRQAGCTNLSLDLIFGLPASLERNWRRDLHRALDLEPQHVSLYGLTVEAHTPLGRWTARGEVRPASDERYAEEYLSGHTALEAAGFRHYEVSNASLPGFEAVHNSGYWRRSPFLGLGPSAHSAWGERRSWNVREWVAYERALASGGSAVAAEESLDAAQLRLENLYLGLRTIEGLPAIEAGSHLAGWVANGWASVRGGRAIPTPEGWLRLDALVAAAA